MIKMVQVSEREDEQPFRSMVVCDYCNGIIDDIRDGNALWVMKRPPDFGVGASGVMYHTHKRCNRMFEFNHGEHWFFWMPLEEHLIHLCVNSSLMSEDLALEIISEGLYELKTGEKKPNKKHKKATSPSIGDKSDAASLIQQVITQLERRTPRHELIASAISGIYDKLIKHDQDETLEQALLGIREAIDGLEQLLW